MFEKWVDETMPQQLEDLRSLIAIPSVSRGEPKEGKPFGEEPDRALRRALEIANRLGFERTKSVDGYCGYADYGEGEEQLLIMAHLDVVPVGTGWTKDPFGGEIADGRMYGRGTIDDKGPAVSALYALAAVKEAGIPLRRSVRVLFGLDEERGSSCMKHYREVEKDPTLAFTPDACYPLVNSEKGITHTTWHMDLSGSAVRMHVGTAGNVIPGEASATLPCPVRETDVPEGFAARFEGNTVTVTGRGGHASQPELARNALTCLLGILAEQDLPAADYAVVSSLHALLAYDMHGEGMGLDRSDASGRLTLSPDVLVWDENGVSLTLDCRHPFSVSHEELMDTLTANFAAIGFTCAEKSHSACLYMPEDCELVKGLLDVYSKRVGYAAKPLAIGGGTYARSFPNAVAFGPGREGKPDECHMPDESIGLDDIRFNTLVMADAIARLAGKE